MAPFNVALFGITVSIWNPSAEDNEPCNQGLQLRVASVKEKTMMPNKKDGTRKGPKDDAEGQFVGTQHGGDNDGVISADPRVISGKKDGDATFPIRKAAAKD
ncbi:hypothetical protein FPY71_09935 [Aureimonas fodinaquatilis]|uniref:Uncharacterized protein n=1 Tax=Aureimonas fodinaquatilis TaxID=2565783 RepID=A0A5B0DWB6_9HYPH|nr:hypothetical protein [Aureimonas fodinaquatilis]KAA0970786.1 hypothetical protein FPY71_09935 [Aureimonas fodinaquatilis]